MDLKERVLLLRPGQQPAHMPLRDAVVAVLAMEAGEQASALISRDAGGPVMTLEEIRAVRERADFCDSKRGADERH